MTVETVGQALAAVNAGLNLTSTVLLLAGVLHIRRGEVRNTAAA